MEGESDHTTSCGESDDELDYVWGAVYVKILFFGGHLVNAMGIYESAGHLHKSRQALNFTLIATDIYINVVGRLRR